MTNAHDGKAHQAAAQAAQTRKAGKSGQGARHAPSGAADDSGRSSDPFTVSDEVVDMLRAEVDKAFDL